MKVLDLKANLEGLYELDAVYNKVSKNGIEAVTVTYNNGVSIMSTPPDFFGNLEFVVSYDGMKNWVEGYTWTIKQFMTHCETLKQMTKEEVGKRV